MMSKPAHKISACTPPSATPDLLGADDPPPFTVIDEEATQPILLVCDHASRRIPRSLGNLGLDPAALDRHIAFDIGAAELTRRLAHQLSATAVLAGYSRLVIDCNRQPGDPQSIVQVSDGTVIPGNCGLTDAEQEARAEAIHWPYHHAIDSAFSRLRRIGPEPVLFSIHTFTPSLGGEDRHWDIGVLWNRDPRLAVPLIELLGQHGGLAIGDNQPYSGRDIAYTLNLHAAAAGLAHAAVEIRQDHCETVAELDRWAEMLADALRKILSIPGIHRIEQF